MRVDTRRNGRQRRSQLLAIANRIVGESGNAEGDGQNCGEKLTKYFRADVNRKSQNPHP